MDITYYDIGLNLFTRSFPNPEKIISDAEADGICCILTGSEGRENRLVDDVSSRPTRESSPSVKPGLTMTACILKKKTRSTFLRN